MASNHQQIELGAADQADELKKQKFSQNNSEDLENDLEMDNKETRDTQNLNSDKQEPTDSELFNKDFANIVLLNVLYFYQGLLIAFFIEYVENYLLLPFSIKFLWAPLMDTYYIKKFGRRKTYVVLAQMTIAVVLFISAFYFENWIENDEVVLSTVGFICVFLLTVQDIAVDSWSVVLLHERNVAYASFSKGFGYIMGNIFGYQIFIDKSLMNTIFGYNGKAVTPFSKFMMMSIAVFAGTFFIIFFRKENDHYVDPSSINNADYQQQNDNDGNSENTPNQQAIQSQQIQQQPEQEGFINMIKSIALFFKNKSILLLILFLMTTSFGSYCVDIPSEIILLNKGFSRSTLATQLFLTPLTQTVSVFAAQLSQKKLEFKIWKQCIVIKTCWNIGNYIVASSFQQEDAIFYFAPMVILSIGDTVLSTMSYIALSAFFLRNCDQSIGGTYITFLNSFSDFGRLWPSLVITSISTHISFTLMFIMGTIYNVLLILFWRNRSKQMQDSDKNNWLIKQQ